MVLRLGQFDLPPDPDKKHVYARSGWQIPQVYLDKLDMKKMEVNAAELKSWHPNIELRSLSNYPYNCVGMIFAARRACIEITHIYEILQEDGYRPISRNLVKVGDVVLYTLDNGDPAHVGLITMAHRYRPDSPSVDIQILSKWGRDAEFLHHIEDVPPLLGKPTAFYTERA